MTGATTIPISVVVPVKNEEANLAGCLERLGRFAEVVVVDSASTDRTPEIARKFGARLIEFKWDGKYPKKRNWVLLNHKLACDWVLFLDADEFIDEAFCAAADDALRSTSHDGFWLNYSNWFRGRRLRYGLPQRKLALFRVDKGLYERVEEDHWSALDMEIHEHPIIDGSVGEIKTQIEHNDDRGVAKFIDRHCDYARWEARRVAVLRRGGPDAWMRLTGRQRFKYRHLDKWWYPWFYFLYTYVVRGGLLDGADGFHYAFYKTWYFQTILLLIAEGQTKGTVAPSSQATLEARR
jgi:glycosyltransferase involved in cell wall biosynthesis